MPVTVPGAWMTRGPILSVPPGKVDDWYSIKDPSIVRHDESWHLFVSVRGRRRSHAIAYFQFAEFSEAWRAEPVILPAHAGYWCAPQVFWFRPHGQWYLVCQAKDSSFRPQYRAAFSTNSVIGDAVGWSNLRAFDLPWPKDAPYLDFWVICDETAAFLFFTCDNGELWRAETAITDFPHGWSRPELAYRGDIFEASHIYATGEGYLCLIESQLTGDIREFRLLVADSLRGPWTKPPGGGWLYAGVSNIRQDGAHWTDSVSHGELLREGTDERMVARSTAPFLFQGVLRTDRDGKPYGEIPWRLGLLEPIELPASDMSGGVA